MDNPLTLLKFAARLLLIAALLMPNYALAAPTTPVVAQNSTDVTFNEGLALYDAHQWQAALAKFEEVQAIYAYYHNIKRESQVWEYIGHTQSELQDFVSAVDAYKQSLALAQTLRDNSRQLKLYIHLTRAHYDQGQYEEALQMQETALELAQSLGDQEWLGKALWPAAVFCWHWIVPMTRSIAIRKHSRSRASWATRRWWANR
ncbi:MAG: tetratricopeptide repeat protein [Caldilineaceae bacterium]